VRLSGHAADDIEIEFSGLRPGEKLYEELLADADATIATPIAQLRIARLESREHAVTGLLRLAGSGTGTPDDDSVRTELMRAVPEYRPA
jgi:FlaA1/EpsC-like NDP-sugar epimerase